MLKLQERGSSSEFWPLSLDKFNTCCTTVDKALTKRLKIASNSKHEAQPSRDTWRRETETVGIKIYKIYKGINPCPAEPGYTLPLQTVQIQISWLLKKPTDLGSALFAIKYVNIHRQPSSSNLIGWKLEMGVAS